jgi:hypothetical protein
VKKERCPHLVGAVNFLSHPHFCFLCCFLKEVGYGF